MGEAKTRPTDVSVAAYLAGIADEKRRQDCEALVSLMEQVTGHPGRMWGKSIVGFDSYHYRYASGHEGDMCVVGFSSGKAHLSIYLVPGGFEDPAMQALLAQLGKYKTAKACLYIKRLADVQLPVLEQVVAWSMARTRAMYPTPGK
ncbi:MAG: DUF1801 domain-containing protein [Gemmataceae bacterium]